MSEWGAARRDLILAELRKGKPLTVREVADRVGLSSPMSAHRHLKMLEEEGIIEHVSGYRLIHQWKG